MSIADPDWARIPAYLHELTATVRAPACALGAADGQILGAGVHGVFVGDVRVLSEARLRFGGVEPSGLAGMSAGPGRSRFVAVARGFGDALPDPSVRIERSRSMTPTGMAEEIRLASVATRAVSATVTVDLRCDLAPLDGVRAGASGPDLTPTVHDGGLEWSGPGMTVVAEAEEGLAEAGGLSWAVQLAPGQNITLRWTVTARVGVPVLVAPAGPIEWRRPRVHAADPRVARLLGQSLDDLESLRLAESADPTSTFIGAGVPWFLTLFGRDSIWAARMMLPLGTDLAAGTLRTLARRQGTRVDGHAAEAPGKIMHELRRDDVRGGGPPRWPATYYGTVDATLLWISLLADAWRWGLPPATVTTLLPHLHRALGWLSDYADPDGDGFVEYIDHSGLGLANQGWKDSFNAVRYHHGGLAPAPIALCEVQGYAHRAALDAADLLDAFGGGEPDRWRGYAADLSTRFRDRYWSHGPLGPFPAMALAADGSQVDSLTSNIGHLLGTGILSADEEATVAALLAGPALAGAYGLRTMSTLDAGYDPLSYHCGSVWPHDTAIALLGLTMAGAGAAADPIIEGLLAAAEAFTYRLPELYGGDGRDEVPRPVPYPGACRPQAWSAAAGVTVLQALLGLTVDVPNGTVTVNPARHDLDVRGLRVAGHDVDIRCDTDGSVTVSGLPPHLRVRPARDPMVANRLR